MITVTPEFRAALYSVENQPVDLYELTLPSGIVRFSDQAITWNGNTYAAKVTSRSAIRRYDGGQFDGVRVQFTNVDTTAAQLFLTNTIEGGRIVIRKVERTVTNDSIVLFHGIMRRAGRMDENTVEIEAEELLAAIDQDVPGRLFTPGCNWVFRGPRCGYAGAGASCDRSWAKCNSYANTHHFGGFRFFGQTGTYQYQDTETKRFLLLFRRKKKTTVTASFASVDDTPYDVPIPIVLGRVQLAGVPIQHVDQGGVTKVLAALCVGPVEEVFYPRANQANAPDWSWHSGADGVVGGQDSRFPASYPYSRLAYVGVTIPSDIRVEDAAPTITAVIRGAIVDLFNGAGTYTGFAWSDNPIWLTRHLLALPLEEGGGGLPYDWFDDATNAAEAAYCNESIVDATNGAKIYYPTDLPTGTSYRAYRPTGVIGSDPAVDGPYGVFGVGDDDTSLAPVTLNVKRFTVNTVIAKQSKLTDILYKKLFAAYRGFHTYSKDGKIQLRVERPTKSSPMVSAIASGATGLTTNLPYFAVGDSILLSPFTAQAEARKVLTASAGTITFAAATYAHAAGAAVYQIAMAFDDANMIGTAAYPLQDRQGSVNRVVVKYTNPAAAFAEQVVHVNDYEHQAQIHRVNSVEVDGSAIDSFFQAYRIGQFQMRKFRELAKFVEVRGNITASLLEIGDVIAVSAVECGLQCVPFRVIEVGFDENDEVAIVGQLYDVAAYDDTAPQTTVTVPAIFGTAVVGGGPGVAVPGDVTNLAGSWALGAEAADGGRLAVLTVTYDAPIPIDEFTGVRVTYQVGSGPVIPAGLYDYPGPVTIEIPSPTTLAAVKVTLASRTAQYEKVADGTTPYFIIDHVGGSLAAQNVASVTVTVSYNGKFWGTAANVTFGSNRQSISQLDLVYIGPLTAGGARIAGTTGEIVWQSLRTLPASGTLVLPTDVSFDRGGATTYWQLEARVQNYQEVVTAGSTRSAVFAVNPVNSSTEATSTNVTVVKYKNADGMWLFRFTCVCTNANDSDYDRTEIYIRKHLTGSFPSGTYADWQLYTESGGGGVGGGFAQIYEGEPIWSLESANIYFQVSFRTVTRAETTRTNPPVVDVTVTPSSGGLRADRFDTATLSSEFSIVGTIFGIANNAIPGTKILDGSITTPKLSTTELDVGGSAARPGRFRVFNTGGAIIGYIGTYQISSFPTVMAEGAWFKEIRCGGIQALTAKFVCDSSGNLSINDGTFTLSLGGVTTTVANVTDGGFVVGLRVKEDSSNRATLVVASQMVMRNSTSSIVVNIGGAAGYGFLQLANSSGTTTITADGASGNVTALNASIGASADSSSLIWNGPVHTGAYAGVQSLPVMADCFIDVYITGRGIRRIPAYLNSGGL